MNHQFLDNLNNILLVGHSRDQLQRSYPDSLISVLYTVHDDIPVGQDKDGELHEVQEDVEVTYLTCITAFGCCCMIRDIASRPRYFTKGEKNERETEEKEEEEEKEGEVL